MEQVYYYKRADGSWIFSVDGHTIVKDANRGAQYHTLLRYMGKETWRLYLDIEADFNLIRQNFFHPSYWEGRTWQMEDNA